MFISGGTDVPGTGVAVRLIAPNAVSAGHRITNATVQLPQSPVGGATFVAIGDENTVVSPAAAATGVQIYAGGSESLTATDLSDVWVASSVATRVTWHAKAV